MKTNNNKILLVDDDPDILEFLRYGLEKEGFEVITAKNGMEAIELAKETKPTLILLDIMMPIMDGVETCTELRSMPQFKDTLIVFLSARSEDYSMIAAFEKGANDYITKPIRPRVLVARINAILQRNAMEREKLPVESKKMGNLEIDSERRVVFKNGVEIVLAKKQFELLLLFSSRPGKIFPRDEIYSKVWGDDLVVGDRTLDVHIRKLREKIGDEIIRTSKGVGYGIDF